MNFSVKKIDSFYLVAAAIIIFILHISFNSEYQSGLNFKNKVFYSSKINGLSGDLRFYSSEKKNMTSFIDESVSEKFHSETFFKGKVSKILNGDGSLSFDYQVVFSDADIPKEKNKLFFKRTGEDGKYQWSGELGFDYSVFNAVVVLQILNLQGNEGIVTFDTSDFYRKNSNGTVTYIFLKDAGDKSKKVLISGSLHKNNSFCYFRGSVFLDQNSCILSGKIESTVCSKLNISINSQVSKNLVYSKVETLLQP